MRTGVDCRGIEWKERELSAQMSDLSSMRFGLLTVLFPVSIQNPGLNATWLCQCDCGNYVVRSSHALKNKTTCSCGCERSNNMKKKTINKHKNVIGDRFGKLVVLDVVTAPNNMKDRRVYYKCICDCGNVATVRSTDLKIGKTTSCGCAKQDSEARKRENLTGRKFGKLTVCGFAYIKNKSAYWHCVCDCGNEIDIRGADLVNGHTESCGCLISVGEFNIVQILNNAKIKYLHNKGYFQDLVSDKGVPLRYDFILLDENNTPIRLIEFDGQQHYDNGKFLGIDEFKKLQHRDALKNQYALSHNIPLVRIPYSKRDTMSLEDLLGDKYLIKGEI